MKKLLLFTLTLLVCISLNAQYSMFTTQWVTEHTALNSTNVYEVDVKTDAAGNIYHLGRFNNGTNWDMVTVKMNVSGTVLWSQTYNSTDQDSAVSIGIDNSGNVYSILTSVVSSTKRMRVVKYNSAGTQQWVWTQSSGVLGQTTMHGVTDASGNTYLTGTDGTNTSVSTYKVSNAGATTWAGSYSPDAFVRSGRFVAVDASANVYVAGWQNTTSNGADWVILKYNSAGTQQWVRTFTNGPTSNDTATVILIDGASDIIVGGEAIIRKYTPTGTLSWSVVVESNPDPNYEMVLQNDNVNNVYVAVGLNSFSGNNKPMYLKKYSSTGSNLWNAWYNGPLASGSQPPPVNFLNIPVKILVHEDSNYVYVGVDGPSMNDAGLVSRGFHIVRFRTDNGARSLSASDWDKVSHNKSYPDPAYTTTIFFADNKQSIIIAGSHKISSSGNPYKIRTVKYKNYSPVLLAHAPSYDIITEKSTINMCDVNARNLSDSCRLEPSGIQSGYSYLWVNTLGGTPTNEAINTEPFTDRTNPNSFFYPPAGAYNKSFRLRVTDPLGNVSYSPSVQILRYSNNPTVFTNGSLTFCAPGNVTLSITDSLAYGFSDLRRVSPAATMQSYAGSYVSSNDVMKYTATTSGQYYFEYDKTIPTPYMAYTGYNFTTFQGCLYRSDTVTVTVNPTPSQPSIIAGTTTACQFTTQTYSVTNVSGVTYNWTAPGGSISGSGNSINITWNSTGSQTVSVTATNSCGTSTASTLSITVNSGSALPQPGLISGGATLCSGSSQPYSIAAVSGATSYTWILPSGWSGTSTSTVINPTAGTNGGIISVTANNSCGSSTAQTLNVTVIPIPAQPGLISGNTNVCEASSQTYSIATVTGATSYTWILPSLWSGASTNTSINTAVGNAGTITVTANNSCGSSTAQTLVISINPPAPSQPGIISGNTTVCSGSSQTYSITPVSGATSYFWSLPGNWSGTSTTNSINTTVGTTGSTIAVSGQNSCGIGASKTLNVTVNTIPTATVNQTGNTLTALETGMTYQWVDCNNSNAPIGGQTNQNFNVTVNGNYAVVVSNGSCQATSSCTNVIVTGVESVNAKQSLNIYPNPSKGIFSIESNEIIKSVQVVDALGKVVFNQNQWNDFKINISLTNLKTGIYFIKTATFISSTTNNIIIE
jgi:hypothetical protein